ncbi:PQQ-dependent sugar dehydrogenase [Bythopirellula polymerisocia]|uniref:Quinoprotein glucose dehydrogenase B n=1 Tax=Bythopirellula polymerisocia TaxID=2528003 RepID=A0A5C6CYX7_9BACT|nr:PQQ-dependent sugar dehydrogenase [Bythopirellula polymerisocia]TWU29832.1 Quinoprotein glucose dehydrogenase B precursor [Bythopirellula polymerisocia]
MIGKIRTDQNRRLQMETLEPRCMLAGDTYLVNFQFDEVLTPTRYMRDVGTLFGDQGNGQFYGWSSDHTDTSRDRGINLDQRLDTLIHFHQNQNWEFALPNGNYEVTVSIGDPEFASDYTLNVEGVNYWNSLALGTNDFRQQSQQISVSDGRLTIDQGAAGEKATRINFVHIVGLPSGPNTAPSAPTITEPQTPGQIVNSADVHMEAIAFFDGDGDLHKSSDWEIWQTNGSPQVVWQTLGIQGVERLHTHLGDGVFVNSHAGRTDLLPSSSFELRVRFRDDAGSVSSYATRAFQTGAASTTFPLELSDVAVSPAPVWKDADSPVNVLLPSASPNQSELRVETESGSLLLKIAGNNGIINTVTNPPSLGQHSSVRVVVVAGSNGLSLDSTNLDISDTSGLSHTLFLPQISLAANARLDLWVSSDGSTFYGTSGQTEPDFSTLARASETAVSVPFTSLRPGYEIDEVAGGLQLPTNIAFVPNPGPNPSDPYFYVTELYGTIKVVSRNFAVSDYATNLLNFNPTGSFPGSGEQGLTGIVVDPISGDVFVTRVTATNPADPNGAHHPQVVRFTSNDGGRTAATTTVIRDMVGESQGQSHQISNLTIGPADGLLYVHNGDGFDASTALNLDSYRGKILRMNLDGTAPTNNPFYNAGNGINARDYVYAYGVRNPFGGAWRAADGEHYEVENGPGTDRLARILRGNSYGWNGSDASMTIKAIYNWSPATAPVNITFVQNETFGGSQFPLSVRDRAFVSESGPTYAQGPQSNGKRIVDFVIDLNGGLVQGPSTFVTYTGNGRATVVGLSAGPDGLYFTELYKDLDAATPIAAGARVFRVRYVDQNPGDYDYDGDTDGRDFLQMQRSFGSTSDLSADGNRDRIVEGGDLAVWQSGYGTIAMSESVVDTSLASVVSEDPASSSVSVDTMSPVVVASLASEGTPAVVTSLGKSSYVEFSTVSEQGGDQAVAVDQALEQLYPIDAALDFIDEGSVAFTSENGDAASEQEWDEVWGGDLETDL